MTAFRIESYILIHSSRAGNVGDILLYNPGSEFPPLARLRFVTQEASDANPFSAIGRISELRTAGEVVVNIHDGAFERIIDTLRNEQPVKFQWNLDTNWAGIYTGEEPIGEAELRG
ncbi:MAG: hypothetical protein O7G83_01310 [Proteobacteria bacterium]|nr:hypothetical protein [Pseudomonadota bacterium]